MRRDPFRPKARSIISQRLKPPEPNPNAPGTEGYKERHRVTETVLPSGMVRVDVGEPLA